jgi:hypothetical protein
MTDWYTSIQCVIWQTDNTPIQSAYHDRLIHINTKCALWHTDTCPSTERCYFRRTHLCCHFSVYLAPKQRYIYIHDLPLLACHTAARCLPIESRSRAVFMVGPVGRPDGPTTNTAPLLPRYEGKTRGCRCSHWVLDDGRENARNMLSCKQTSG